MSPLQPSILRCLRYGRALTTCFSAAALLAVLLVWATSIPASAEEPKSPAIRVPREWLLLGPIAASDEGKAVELDELRKTLFEADLLADSGGEANVAAKADQQVMTVRGERTWRVWNNDETIVDLGASLGPHENAAAYAVAEIDSPQAGMGLLGIGSDDAVRVWLNGKLVHEKVTQREVRVDDDIVVTDFQEGKNLIVLKIVNARGEWGFACRLLEPMDLGEELVKQVGAGNLERVRALLDAGVDPNAGSELKITAEQLARVRGYQNIAELLVSRGAEQRESFDPVVVLDQFLTKMTSPTEPGVAVLFARDGKLLYSRGWGLADLSHDVAISPHTKFRIGSVTKQFAAAGILKLQEQGRLSVRDKVSQYFLEFPRGDEVTLHHLLTHTSGIKSFTSKTDFREKVSVQTTPADVIDSIKNDPYDFDPGQQFAYNNSGYVMLGLIIEKVSGQSFADYLRENFWKPLGMQDTGVHDSRTVLKNEATGYSYEAGQIRKSL
ncbi:MAG: beta-lactamase family protein, partial [Planctomycetales bacterium]|nr:beta-lactamase family protein [Planctomycetales bacterium]